MATRLRGTLKGGSSRFPAEATPYEKELYEARHSGLEISGPIYPDPSPYLQIAVFENFQNENLYKHCGGYGHKTMHNPC